MGSSTKRKSNDRPVINRPKSNNGAETGGVSGTRPEPVDINNLCPLAFDVKLDNQLTPVGSKLILEGKLLISIEGVVVGRLTPLQYELIKKCSLLGYTYQDIKAVERKGLRYAEVKR
jgi:hypothetical protein